MIRIGENGEFCQPFNIRIDELKIIDIAFLHNTAEPTVAVLYEDTKEQRHVKTYTITSELSNTIAHEVGTAVTFELLHCLNFKTCLELELLTAWGTNTHTGIQRWPVV